MNAVLVRRLGCMSARAGWGALAAVHVPAVLAVGRALVEQGAELGRVTSLLALALSIVFFLLKTLGVPMLRVRSPRRATVVFCLVAALVHAETRAPVLHPGVAGPATVAVVTAVAGPRLLPRGRALARAWSRLWSGIWRRLLVGASLGTRLVRDRTGLAEPERAALRRREILWRLAPPRAPPVAAS